MSFNWGNTGGDDTTFTLPLSPANGGTGLSSYAVGDLIYASGATTLAKLADVAVGRVLISGGVGVAPSYSATPILGVAGTTAGTLRFSGLTSGVVTVDVAAVAGTWAFTLPATAGTADYAMITDGSGNASWSILPVAGGGTGSGTAAGAASALGLGTEDSPTFTGLTTTGDALIGGNLTVDGASFTADFEMLVGDNHIYMNSGYTAVAAQTAGLAVNYLPTATNDTVAAGGFTAGVASTSNPTVITVGSATFSAADLIQISGATVPENNGLFEVLTHVGTTLTIKGVGLTATVEDVSQNQFTTSASVAGVIRKVNVSIWRSGTDGIWETAKGANTGAGLTYSDVVDAATLAAWTGSTNVTTLGTIATGTWSATAIAADKGGTGQTVYAVGDLLYASTTTALSKLADVAVGSVLVSGGVDTAPAYSTTPQITRLGIGAAADAAQLLTLAAPATLTSGNITKTSFAAATTLAGTTVGHFLDASTNVTLGSQILHGYKVWLPVASSAGNGEVEGFVGQLITGATAGSIAYIYSATGTGRYNYTSAMLADFTVLTASPSAIRLFTGTPTWGATGTGSLSQFMGLYWAPTMTPGNGVTSTAALVSGLYVLDCTFNGSGTEVITEQDGCYVGLLTKGGINKGYYAAGAAVASVSGAINSNYTFHGDSGSYRWECDQTQASADAAYLNAFDVPACTITWTGTTAVTTATGVNLITFGIPTHTGDAGVVLTAAATVKIAGDPAFTTMSATNAYGLWNAGKSRFDGNVGFGGVAAAAGVVDVLQSSTTGAIPVLKLTQNDVSEEFIRFVGTSADGGTQSLVDATDMTTPGALKGWVKVYIQDDQATNPITDGVYYVPFYAAPTA